MRRRFVLLLLAILGVAAIFWLQQAVRAGGASGNDPALLLVWSLGGAGLALLLLLLNGLWIRGDQLQVYAPVLSSDVQVPIAMRAQSEQQTPRDADQGKSEGAIGRSVARAEALVRTAARLNQYVDRQALLEVICEEAAGVLNMPVSALALYDAKREHFRLAASFGISPSFHIQTPPLPLAWFRQEVGHTRQPVVVLDLRQVEISSFSQHLLQYQLRTVAFVELHYRDRLLGLLLVSTLRVTRDISPENLNLLGGLADQAAQALTNANLFKALPLLLQRTQRQSRQMQRIMDAVPDGLLLLSAERRVLLANAAGHKMLAYLAPQFQDGMPLRQLGGQDIESLLVMSDRDEPWKELQSAGGADGEDPSTRHTFELTARALEDDVGEGAWIVLVRDVTAERERRQVAQSQDRLATVGQLAAGIAHDFNNIMAVITLYSQALERNPDFPKRREYLATISEQAQHASTLITQILDFSRSAIMERGRLDLLPFVKEMVKLLQRTLPENIAVTLQAEAGKYMVSADPTRLQQALMNLALNARDAMPGGGTLQISLARVTLRTAEAVFGSGLAPGRYMCLSVADNGQGIPREAMPHLFEPFFTTKEAGKGTGMGLAQVYGIVKQHGGDVEVDSSPGKGTRFTLYLPALEPAMPSEPQSELPGTVIAGAVTILLVEDHEPTREAIRDTLEMLGYNVLIATTGREALAQFDAHGQTIDLVLSDMVMPEMGGVELYRNLMGRDPDVKMMVMTGYPLENEGRSLLEQGILDWIRKPFSPDALGAKISELLSREVR